MKKNIFLTLALSLAFAGTAWGQTTEYFEVTSVTFNANYPFVYDGTAKTYITSFADNCSLNDGSLTGNTATNAGSYTATISSQCYGHGTYSGTDYYEEFHVGSVTYNWSILPRDISKTSGYADGKYVTITVNDKKWTGSEINISDVYTIKFEGANLTAADYDVYVTKGETPTTIKDEGRYTIVFTGKGNFTGTITRTFDVKKDLNAAEALTGIHFDIPTQLKVDATTDFAPATEYVVEVTDNLSHTALYKTTDYTLKFFNSEDEADKEIANDPLDPSTPITAITAEGKYWVVAAGVAPKYEGRVKKVFYVVNEYQLTTDAEKISLHITDPGYPVAETSPTGAVVNGKMKVGDKTEDAVAEATKTFKIPATKTVTASDDITFDIVGIEDGAFQKFSILRYIDATDITGFVPSSLDRDAAATPFYKLPKQTLVYLNGVTVEGENYIYKFGADDYRCDIYKIYDDNAGTQLGFADENAAKWDITIPISFKANTVTNTRQMNATAGGKQQGYTVCLPYALTTLPKELKVYTLKYSKGATTIGSENYDGLVGAEEETELKAMTPYIVIPSASGQLLSTTDATIEQTYDAATPEYVAITPAATQAVSGQSVYNLCGTMQWMEGVDASHPIFIMQKDNVWKKIESAGTYQTQCILPMRAYIQDNGTAASRLYTVFNNADGSTTGIANLQIDADTQAEVYDLQGRKVAAPQRGGLYIVNGKKMLMK